MKKVTAIILSIMVAMMFSAVNVVYPAEAFADGTIELFYNGMDEQDEAEVSDDGTTVTYNGVTYNMNGGKAAWDDSEGSYQLTKEGSEFKNWNTEIDESGTGYIAGLEVEQSLVDGQTLYAIWSESADADDGDDEDVDKGKSEDGDKEPPAKKDSDPDEPDDVDKGADDIEKDADVDEVEKDADADNDDEEADAPEADSKDNGFFGFKTGSKEEPEEEPTEEPAEEPTEEPEADLAPQQQETFAFLEMKGPCGEGQESVSRLDVVDQILFGGVVFDPNGGKTSLTDTEYEFIPPETEDKTFVLSGWNTEEDGSGETFAPGDTVEKEKVLDIVTVYAMWTEEDPAATAAETPAEDPSATPETPADDPAVNPEDPAATPEVPEAPAEDPAANQEDPEATPEVPAEDPAAEVPEINSEFSVEVNHYEITHNETYYYQPVYFERHCCALYDRMGYTNVTYVPCDYVHPSFRCLSRQGYRLAAESGENYDEIVELPAKETGYYDNGSKVRSGHNPQTGENRVWMMYLVLLQGVAALLCVIIILRRYVL